MKKVTLFFISIFSFLAIFAGEVTEAEALQKARQFMQGKQFTQRHLHRAPAFDKNKSFYVFNADGQNGFVIVSGDDRAIPILGYAEQGSLDMDKLPTNVKAWLEDYARQIKALSDASIAAAPHRILGAPVKPLLTSKWGQTAPYNNMCPMDGDYHSVTGCVATAMAQVMYYYKYPQSEVAAMPNYDLPATTFKWDKMKDEYYEETDESADAVAELMLYCGRAVDMEYSESGSFAHVSAYNMINTFLYSKGARDVNRRDYTSQEWDMLIYHELSEKRPVLYSGQSSTVGHEFVVDGYDSEGYFHINWGWDGSSDGYFALSVLNPYDLGMGGGSSSNGYTMWQEAIVGLQPDNGEPAASPLVYYEYSIGGFDNTTYSERTSSEEDFSASFKANIFHFNSEEIPVEVAFALYKGSERVCWKEVKGKKTIQGNGIVTQVQEKVNFGKDITEGTFVERTYYRMPGTEEWLLCSNYDNMIALWTIKGNKLTRSVEGSGTIPGDIQINSVKIKGIFYQYQNMAAIVNWTNNGYLNENTFVISASGTNGSVSEKVSSYVAPEQTGEFTAYFTSTSSGEVKISIATLGGSELWSNTYTFNEGVETYLNATVEIEGEKFSSIEETTLRGKVNFVNDGDDPYDDDVLIKLRLMDDESGDFKEISVFTQHLTLNVGEEKVVEFEFSDLEAGRKYWVCPYFYTFDVDFGHYAKSAPHGKQCTVGIQYEKMLTMTEVIKNINADNIIPDGEVEMILNVNYTGASYYSGYIIVRAERLGEDNEYHFMKEGRWGPGYIGASEEMSVPVDIYGLLSGTYRFACYIINQKDEEKLVYTTGNYTVRGLLDLTVNVKNVQEETHTIEGNAIMTDLYFENPSDRDFYETVFLVVRELNKDGEVFNDQVSVDFLEIGLSPGRSKTLNDYMIKGLEVGKYYDFILWYWWGDIRVDLYQSHPYTMVNSQIAPPFYLIGTVTDWKYDVKYVFKKQEDGETYSITIPAVYNNDNKCWFKIAPASAIVADGNVNWSQLLCAPENGCEQLEGTMVLGDAGAWGLPKVDGVEEYIITINPSTLAYSIVTGRKPGDVNGDGKVNDADIAEIVNYILGESSAKFNKEAADVSGDGDVNVTDIFCVVSIILSGDNSSASASSVARTGNLVVNGTGIQLRNAEYYTAAQFDINQHDGQPVSSVILNGSSNHLLAWKMMDASTCRVVVYSPTNEAFRTSRNNLFNVVGNLEGAAISNDLLIETDETTGIEPLKNSSVEGWQYYDLNGRKVNTPSKGVYILNGKKVVMR